MTLDDYKLLNEGEKHLIKLVNDVYKMSIGREPYSWEERRALISYRFRKQHPLSKIIMTRNGPKIIDFKEEESE